jgi:hypothetical protein
LKLVRSNVRDGKPVERVDREQPLEGLEGLPRVAACFPVSGDREAERLAGEIVGRPQAVVVRVDHLARGQVSGDGETAFRDEPVADVAVADFPFVEPGLAGERQGAELDATEAGLRQDVHIAGW